MPKNHLIAHAILISLIICVAVHKYSPKPLPPPPVQRHFQPIVELESKPIVNPLDFTISTKTQDHYLKYPEVITQLKQWNQEAKNISEFGTYGKTIKGTDCYYLRIGTVGKPKVLLHSCIHGDERLATGCFMGFMGQFLSDKSDEVKWILENRDIYFVPVLSPDTYLRSRHVEGQDPNRSYPCPKRPNNKPPSPIQLIMDFSIKHNFKATISNHTFGRLLLTPSIGPKEDKDKIIGLANEMSQMNNYTVRTLSAIDIQGNGYEVDWYYQNGSAAILIEWSNGPDHDMPFSKVQPELDKNYKPLLLFLKKAPDITLSTSKN